MRILHLTYNIKIVYILNLFSNLMLDESFEEDCTIYIEELKSDDPNLKMNAVSKVTSIAQIIGPSRVCEELVPYLIEIIEE